MLVYRSAADLSAPIWSTDCWPKVPVRVLDDFSTGKEANLAPAGRTCEVLRGSVTKHDDVRGVAGCDTVFHLAAVAERGQERRRSARLSRICATGTLRVLDAARRSQGAPGGVRRQQQRLWRSARPAGAKTIRSAAVSLRRGQTGRRTLLLLLLGCVWSGNGAAGDSSTCSARVRTPPVRIPV